LNNNKTTAAVRKPGSVRPDRSKAYGAAEISVSARTRAGSRGLTDTSIESQERILKMQTADMEMQTAEDVLQRMRSLAVRSSDSAASDADRVTLDYDFTKFKFELCTLGSPRFYYVDPDEAAEAADLSLLTDDYAEAAADTTGAANVDSFGSIRSADGAEQAVSAVDDAIKWVSSSRDKLDEAQSALRSELRSAGMSTGGKSSSENSVRDADAAKKVAENIRSKILVEQSRSTSAQANAVRQQVYQMLA